jgi:hypothetical protein
VDLGIGCGAVRLGLCLSNMHVILTAISKFSRGTDSFKAM